MSTWMIDLGVKIWGQEGYKKAYEDADKLSRALLERIEERLANWTRVATAGWLGPGYAPLDQRFVAIVDLVGAARRVAAEDKARASGLLTTEIGKLQTLERDVISALRALMIPALKMAEELNRAVGFMAGLSPGVSKIGPLLKKVDPKACTGMPDYVKAMAAFGPAISAFADAASVAQISAGGDSVALGQAVIQIKARVAKRQMFGAAQLCADTFDVTAIAKARQDYEQTMFKQLGDQLKRVSVAFDGIKTEEKVAIKDTIALAKAIGDDWDLAEAAYGQGKYAAALVLAQTHEARVVGTIDAVKKYVPDQIKTRLDQLALKANFALAQPLLEEVPKTLDTAARMAAFGMDFSAELSTLHEVCDKAEALLADAGKLDSDLGKARASAKAVADSLKKHKAYAKYFKDRMDLVEPLLGDESSKEDVEEALETLKVLAELAPGHTAYAAARNNAESLFESVTGHKQTAYAAAQKLAYAKLLKDGDEKAADDRPLDGVPDATKAQELANTTQNLLRTYVEYLDALARFDDFYNKLKAGLAVEHQGLLKFLEDARSLAVQEALAQKVPEARKALNDGLDDARNMDAVVAKLKPAVAGAVVKKALESRFHLDLRVLETETTEIDYNAKNVSIRRIYEVMKTVPDKHHRGTQSFKKVDMFPKEVGISYYSQSEKLIQLKCGRADDDADEELANTVRELTLPIDVDCKRKGDAPKAKRFNFTVLHEVGHAVDDHEGFMLAKRDDGAFAAWKAHTIAEVVNAVYAVWPYDKGYLYEALCGNAVQPVDQPLTYTGLNWDKERTDALAWIALVREDAQNWWDGAKCVQAQAKFGGRVFVESYARTWFSYENNARKKGISGYQFRSPYEWFAELYAAYRCDQLKSTHPAVQNGQGWLPKLFT